MTRRFTQEQVEKSIEASVAPRTNNMLERIMREIRRRTRVVGNFPDGRSALVLAAARLRHVTGTRWGTRRYMDMERLQEQTQELQTEKIAQPLQPCSL